MGKILKLFVSRVGSFEDSVVKRNYLLYIYDIEALKGLFLLRKEISNLINSNLFRWIESTDPFFWISYINLYGYKLNFPHNSTSTTLENNRYRN